MGSSAGYNWPREDPLRRKAGDIAARLGHTIKAWMTDPIDPNDVMAPGSVATHCAWCGMILAVDPFDDDGVFIYGQASHEQCPEGSI
jgi:hypothetical protein